MKKQSKFCLCITLAVVLMASLIVFAACGEGGGNSSKKDLSGYSNLNLTQATLDYVLSNDGESYSCVGLSENNNQSDSIEVVIPDTYNGLPVTMIEEGAFRGCEKVIRVIMGKNVTWIDNYAFSDCFSLISVIISDRVAKIKPYAFANCSQLVEVINHSSLIITKGSKGCGYVAYCALNVKQSGTSDIVNIGKDKFFLLVDCGKI